MKVTERDVSYVADLASLELTDSERERMLRDLNSILEYIDRLNQLDTRNVAPMAQVLSVIGEPAGADPAGSLRSDQKGQSLDRSTVLRGAPAADESFFKVPKVIDR